MFQVLASLLMWSAGAHAVGGLCDCKLHKCSPDSNAMMRWACLAVASSETIHVVAINASEIEDGDSLADKCTELDDENWLELPTLTTEHRRLLEERKAMVICKPVRQ